MPISQLQWKTLDDMLIGFISPGQLPDEGLDLLCQELQAKPVKTYLSTSYGVVDVNSMQRKKVVDVLTGRGTKIAVVTDERLVRGIVTAASWLGLRNVKTFAWADVTEAVGFLEPRFDVARAVGIVMQMLESWERSAGKKAKIAR